ncbi:4958_t:CDS:2, partial [Racocetra fulgida]
NIDFTAISKFVSIDSTYSPGTSAAAHVEVDRLLSLLEGKKAKIDHILDSQHVYAVGIDFQKGYSMPCITCWVTKYLDIAIKEQLSDLFENEFEIIETILTPTDTDFNNSNSTPPSVTSASRVITKESSEIFQEFDIVAAIHANVDPTNGKHKILKFFVDVKECGMGPMISEKSSLHKLGL